MKRLLIIVMLVLPLCVAAQKIGVVDSKAIFEAMPEKVEAEKQLNDLLEQYKAENTRLEKEFNQKYGDFQALPANTAKSIKERRMQEIQENRHKIASYQVMVKQDMDTKKAEVLAPIKAKLQAAIDSVSTQGDYMLVLDISSTPVAYKSAKVVDITAEVKTALGIAK